MSSTTSRFVQDLNRIVQIQPQGNTTQLQPVHPEPIQPVRSIGEINEPPQVNSGGIASPLKEIANLREYHEPELISSSDGLFVYEQQVIKKAVFEDADGAQIVLEFAHE